MRSAQLSILAIMVLVGCDQMITPRNAQTIKDADAKVAEGDYQRAISLYEAALTDSQRRADIHYKLALVYDDKMNDPLNAIHHFKRYLVISPNGTRAREVKDLIKRDEIALATSLSGDSVLTHVEAARLKNDNLTLRRELEERAPKARLASDKAPSRNSPPEKATKAGGKSYVVKPGDTLVSISRKFYHSSKRWKEIRDANKSKIDNPTKLQPGETLTIP